MIGWIIAAVVWLIGIFVAYKCVIKKWDNFSTFEKIWFSVFWPALVPLFIFHYIRTGHC